MRKIAMKHCAWCARAWAGKWPSKVTQKEIANEIGISPSLICSSIRKFFDENHKLVDQPFGRNHLDDVRKVVEAYASIGGEFEKPIAETPMRPRASLENDARQEHAWLLRAEGLKLKEIGQRLGVTSERARAMIKKFGSKMKRAMRRTRWHYEND